MALLMACQDVCRGLVTEQSKQMLPENELAFRVAGLCEQQHEKLVIVKMLDCDEVDFAR